MKESQLERMTWVDALRAFKETQTVVIPTGSTEQHGPHMPLGTDFMIASKLAKMVGERANVIVIPTFPFGYAKYHTDFPGTLAIEEDTFAEVFIEICDDLLRYGIKRILVINGHGGNIPSLHRVGAYLRQKEILMAIASWWKMVGALNPEWKAIGHGDYVEASAILSIDQSLVRMERYKFPQAKPLTDNVSLDTPKNARFRDGIIEVNLRTRDMVDRGDMIEYGLSAGADYTIPTTKATKDRGDAMLDALADYLADFVKEFEKVSLPAVDTLLVQDESLL